MKNNKVCLILLSMCAVLGLNACHLEETDGRETPTFEQTYNNGFVNGVTSVCETTDGDYVLAAYELEAASDPSPMVLRLSPDGQLRWKKIVTSGIYFSGQVLPSEAGSVYLGISGPGDLKMARVDAAGSTEKIFNGLLGFSTYPSPLEQFTSGLARNATDLAACGSRQESGNWQVALLRFNYDGTGYRTRSYGGAQRDAGLDMKPIGNDGFVICGYTESYGTGGDAYLLRVRDGVAGNHSLLTWQKNFGGNGEDMAKSIVLMPDNGYLICGYSESYGADRDMYLLRTDADGNKLWDRTYARTGVQEANSLSPIAGGNFLLVGTAEVGDTTKMYAATINPQGDLLWEREFGKNLYNSGNYGIPTSDGAYLLVGTSGGSIYCVKTPQ